MNFAWLLAWASSWFVMVGAGLLGLAGVAGLVWGQLPLVRYKLVATIAGGAALALSCFLAGIGSEKALGEAAALRAQLAASQKAEAFKDAQLATLAEDSAVREQQAATIVQLEDHVRDLTARLPGRTCLDGDAAGRVRDLWK